MTKRLNGIVIAVILAVTACGGLAFAEWPEIPKNLVTASSPTTLSSSSAANVLDNNLNIFWENNQTMPCHLRFDFGAGNRWRVTRFDILPFTYHCAANFEVYVTDSESTDKADWGTMVASGTFPYPPADVTLPDGGRQRLDVLRENGRFLILWMSGGNARSLIKEVWFYGEMSAGPVFTADPDSFRIYTGTTASATIGVAEPGTDTIQAGVAVDDFDGVISSVTINGTDVTAGAGDVLSFAAPDWDATEGPVSITTSSVVGTATVTVVESDSGGYTPQNVLAREIAVQSVPRVVKLSLGSFQVLALDQAADILVQIADAQLAAPGQIPVSIANVTGTSATIQALGADISDGERESAGSILVLASAATPGITEADAVAGNGFVFQETGTDTVHLRISVVGTSAVYVSPGGNDVTGDGSEASPLRSITTGVAAAANVGEVRVLPGFYSPSSGEIMPISPGSVSIVGYDPGTADPDNYVVDGEASTESLFAYANTVVGFEGSIANLTLTGSTKQAINADGGLFSLDNCVFTDITSGSGAPAAIKLYNNSNVTATGCSFQNLNGRGAVGAEISASVSEFHATDCTFSGNTSSIGTVYAYDPLGEPYGKFWLTECVFENNTAPNTAPSWGGHYACTGVYMQTKGQGRLYADRCKFIGGSGGSVFMLVRMSGWVKSSLFVNNQAGGSMFDGYEYALPFTNCTFVGNSGAFAAWSPLPNATFANCVIADNGVLCKESAAALKLYLKNVILWNTPLDQGYNTASSSNVIEANPLLLDDYRLKRASPAVDAGDDSYLSGDAFDLAGKPRFMDGNGDDTPTVDIGCYEFDPDEVFPAFATAQTNYHMVAGDTITVPVSVVPAVAGTVTAAVTYGNDITGPGTLDLPDGAGPADLAITASGTPGEPGTPSAVDITETSANGVQSGQFFIYPYERKVTIGRASRIFVPNGVEFQVHVALPSELITSHSVVTITPGSPAGSGTNTIAWVGGASIPDGSAQSDGYLSITGGTGINSISLDVDNGFTFTESGAASLLIQVVGYSSPLYVSGFGADDGDGSPANPLRTITYAASLLSPGEEVRVLPGAYAPSSGEVLPIRPDGVRIVGYDPAGTDVANHVVTGEGAAQSLFLFKDTPDGSDGYLANLTLTGCAAPAILADNGRLALDGCCFRDIISGAAASGIRIINDGAVTADACEFTNLNGYGTVGGEVILVNTLAFTATNCRFTGNYSTIGTVYAFGPNWAEPRGTWVFTDCVFDGNRVPDSKPGHEYAATAFYVYGVSYVGAGTLTVDRCSFLNGQGGCTWNLVRIGGSISNSLFAGNNCHGDMFIGYEWNLPLTNCTFVGNSGGFAKWNPIPTTRLINCVVSDNVVLNGEGTANKLVLTNTLLWNTPLGTGYDVGASSNVIEQDPRLAAVPTLVENGRAFGKHWAPVNDVPIIRYFIPVGAENGGLELGTAYTIAIKHCTAAAFADIGGAHGKAAVDLGAARTPDVWTNQAPFAIPAYTGTTTVYRSIDDIVTGWWQANCPTPATLPEGQDHFILTIAYTGGGFMMDRIEIRDPGTGETVHSIESENPSETVDPTGCLVAMVFEWFTGTIDAHLTTASPAIDAGNNDLAVGDADLENQPRFHDGNGDDVPTVDLGCYEYQGEPGATIAAFTVSDRTSGSTLVTNEADVTVAIDVTAPEGVTVVNWQITESDVEPAEWLTESPTAYTIQAASGADVILYAWIKDSADNVSSKPAAIYYNTAIPVVSNVVITAGAPGAALVAWDTDIPAEGAVMYGVVSMVGTTPNTEPENAISTSHSVALTGLADATQYKLILVNNEATYGPIYWPKPWPIEGDANMDCRVNILDLISIRNKLNQDVATGDNWKADVNEDGRINILDLIFVRNKLNTQCP